MHFAGASKPLNLRALALAKASNSSGLPRNGATLSSRSRTLRSLAPVRDHRSSEGDGAAPQVALGDDRIEQAGRVRGLRRDRRPRRDRLHRGLGSDEAWQTLGAPGARQQAELDLRQSHFRGRDGDPVMAGERGLETAPQRHAMQRRDDGLRAALDHVEHVMKRRGLRRLGEFRDVGAAGKPAARPEKDDRLDRRIRLCGLDCLYDLTPKRSRQRIHRRRVEAQHGDVAFRLG